MSIVKYPPPKRNTLHISPTNKPLLNTPPVTDQNTYPFHQWLDSLPEGLTDCPSCGTPPCCNPALLFLDATLGNIKDVVAI